MLNSISDLAVDAEGKLHIETQDKLDDLLSGNSSRCDTARRSVLDLSICDGVYSSVARIAEAWPSFPRLEALSIAVNGDSLESFPSVLSSSIAPALQHLSLALSSFKCEWECPELQGHFVALQSLHIDGFPLSYEAVLEAMLRPLQAGRLPRLSKLTLWNNGMGAAGCATLSLALRDQVCAKLTLLNLDGNGIGDEGCAALAKALREGACPALTHLSLERNCIGDEGCASLGEGVQSCFDLECLNLRCNDISALPDALGELQALSTLDISGNSVRTIQLPLANLIMRLTELDASDNPLEDPPEHVMKQGLAVLQNYMRELQRSGLEELRTARVMLVGGASQGKTTLCRALRLAGAADEAGAEATQSTHAIDICDWTVDEEAEQREGRVCFDAVSSREPLTIKLWDTAGKAAYLPTHQFFFSPLCVYVLVVRIEVDDGRMQDAIASSIDWLITICKAVPARAQIMVVGTFPHSQRGESQEGLVRNLERLGEALRAADRARVQEWNTDARGRMAAEACISRMYWVDCHSDSDSNVGRVRSAIVRLAENVVESKQKFPVTYRATLAAHEELCEEARTGIASFQAFRDIVVAKMQNAGAAVDIDEAIKGALMFASDVGILQYHPRINDRIVFLNPLFLVEALGVLIYDWDAYRSYVTGILGGGGGRKKEKGKTHTCTYQRTLCSHWIHTFFFFCLLLLLSG